MVFSESGVTMTNETFLAALKATAKVACCASIISNISCQTQPKKNPQLTSMDEASSATQQPDDSTSNKSKPENPSISPIPEIKPIVPQSEEFVQCNETISNFFGKNPTPVPESTEIPKTVVDCCDLQANAIYDISTKWSNRNLCCDIFNWMGPAACTPWGPPMPPSHVSS